MVEKRLLAVLSWPAHLV